MCDKNLAPVRTLVLCSRDYLSTIAPTPDRLRRGQGEKTPPPSQSARSTKHTRQYRLDKVGGGNGAVLSCFRRQCTGLGSVFPCRVRKFFVIVSRMIVDWLGWFYPNGPWDCESFRTFPAPMWVLRAKTGFSLRDVATNHLPEIRCMCLLVTLCMALDHPDLRIFRLDWLEKSREKYTLGILR